MSLYRPSISNEFTNSDIDELRWVIHIRQTLEEEHDEEDDNGEFLVSIFNVPKSVMASDPDSYVPKQIAIGPYHCWRSELRDIERVKLAATKRLQKKLQTISLNIEQLVDQLRKYEHGIRACYSKYLNFNGETLMWMMIIDASFLLEFLQEGRSVIQYGGRKLLVDQNETLRDIIMLENQIPLFVLRKVLEFKLSSSILESSSADDSLLAMLMGLFREISPFKTIKENYSSEITILVSQCAHLLEFLYNMIVLKLEEEQTNMIDFEEEHKGDMEGTNETSFARYVKQALSEIWRMASKLTKSSISFIQKALLYQPLKFVICLPLTIIRNHPMVGMIKHPLEYLFFSQENNEQSKSEIVDNKPPLMEEITIPSVTELTNSGICFSPINNGAIESIRFDAEAATLHLPTIAIDINSQVLLRNLVAYEASIKCGPLVFTRYTEFMNGIIDSKEDAKILREKGIVLNHLKSDEQVANLWNGMSRSIKLTKVPFLDKVIEDVNKYYNGRMSVKAWRFMKLYVFGSWQFLTFLVVVLIFLLMFLQAFCFFHGCNRRNHVKTSG
ncbi:hypothetical protein QN277_019620 [Acacia crassicarpa]|uniref:Uncharacterized protein n=1 Tax=Acacia crassicarpa TaxID=499986 RepID=A0AAE1MRY8_9FABA|nr:hypothetical protein QN277_019620 [Acacia crassicarpa]